jgi:ABC-type phosphate transport system substrate-binding protein
VPRAALIVLVVVLGCNGGARRAAPPPGRGAGGPSLAQAEAFERGAGVARDYTRAAAIYEQLCQDGKGDVVACRRLVEAIAEARGVKFERERLVDLSTAMCLAAGDPASCSIAMFMWFRRDAPTTPMTRAIEQKLEEIDAEHFEERCEAGEVRACEGYLTLSGMAFSQSGTVEEKRRAATAVRCADGHVASCGELIEEVTGCGALADPQPCVDRVVDDWSQRYGTDELQALERLRGWCKAGDAQACKALPGQAIAWAALCDAHDYGACAELGCRGDAAARKLAAAHGLDDDDCTSAPHREADAAPAAGGPARLVAEPPLPPVTPADKLPFDSLRFRTLGIRDDSGWPRFEVQNLGKRKVVAAVVVIYAHDGAGQQLARSWPEHASFGSGLEPGATGRPEWHPHDNGYRAGSDPAVTYEVCYESISFDRDSWEYRTRCPRQKPKGARWGDGNARKVITVSAMMSLDASAPDAQTVHALDERHAAAFEAAHPEVMIEVVERYPRRARRGHDRILLSASTARAEEPRTERVPLMVTPVAVVYRLDGVDGLRLSPETLVKIFQGDILAWSHAAIQKDNPGVALPDVPIRYRVATSSRGDPFVRYLKQHAGARWRVRDWPPEHQSHGTPPDRAAELVAINGSISHMELHLARAHKLQIARVRNRAGVFVEPSAAGASAAAAAVKIEGDLSFEPLDAPGAAAYPIVYTTYAVLVPSVIDTATWPWITGYLGYLLGDAQATFAQDDLGALPPALAARAAAYVNRLPPQ